MAATQVSLKLFINKESQQLLFAEADKEFIDFLLSIFTLPVRVVTRILKEGGGMVGSCQSLYQSIENLSVTHIQPDKSKRLLLEPKVVSPGAKLPLLLPNVASTFCQLYKCPNSIIPCSSYVADDNSAICPNCGCGMNQIVTFIDPPNEIRASSPTSEEGYVKGSVKYIVMNDLEVKPTSSGALVSLLAQLNVNDIRDIEEKVVNVGMDEGMKMLKAFFQSKTVLTDVFLSEKSVFLPKESSKTENITWINGRVGRLKPRQVRPSFRALNLRPIERSYCVHQQPDSK